MGRKMLKKMSYLQLVILLASVARAAIASGAVVDTGTASYYSSPYTPTVCYGGDPSQLPSNNMSAAAGGVLWDNGAACGGEYRVRCISASQSIPGNCKGDGWIEVKIVDSALSSTVAASASSKQAVEGDAFVLSETAFKSIAKPFADSIDVEYQAV